MRNSIWIALAGLALLAGMLVPSRWRGPQVAAAAEPQRYQYYVLDVGGLVEGLDKYPNYWDSHAPAEARRVTRQDVLHSRVIKEVNRLGNEGWELCKADEFLPELVVRPEGRVMFRRPR
jgi:hypothetical protein